MTGERFAFADPGVLSDGELELVCVWTRDGDPARRLVATYEFEIRREGARVGRVGFRCQDTDYMRLYAGNIGYGVDEHARGHRYAARAVAILRPFMKRHLTTAWIAIDPDNVASRRTAERVGAVFVEIVDLMPDDEQYQDGERQKCRYRLDL